MGIFFDNLDTMPRPNMKNLGALGETTFKLWCDQVGLVANPSIEDKTGWDFHVESVENYRDLSAEVHSSPLEFRVQVKATDKRDRKLAIPLSNLWRMTTLQLPTFYVFLEFDGQSQVQEAFLVHIDSELTSRIIKRLHENDHKEEPSDLHKTTFTITYGEEHRLQKLNGEELLKKLREPVKQGLAEYIANKKQYLETVGYDERSFLVSFSIAESDISNLVESSLGFDIETEFFDAKAYKARFGLTGKKSIFESEAGKIKFTPEPFSSGKVTFKEAPYSAGLTFDIEFFRPAPIVLDLPSEQKKVRIKSKLFDILLFVETNKIVFSHDLRGYVDVRDLSKVLKLMRNLRSKCFIELDLVKLDRVLKFHLLGTDSEETVFEEQIKATQHILDILDIYEFSEPISVLPDELEKHSSQYQIFIDLLSFGDARERELIVETTLEDSDFLIDEAKPLYTVGSTAVRIGEYLFGVVYSVMGHYENTQGDRYRLKSNKVLCETKFVMTKDDFSMEKLLEEIMKPVVDKYDASGSNVFIANGD